MSKKARRNRNLEEQEPIASNDWRFQDKDPDLETTEDLQRRISAAASPVIKTAQDLSINVLRLDSINVAYSLVDRQIMQYPERITQLAFTVKPHLPEPTALQAPVPPFTEVKNAEAWLDDLLG